MNLNQLLKSFRVKNDMTQEQLADKIHVSHQTISKWEQGINTPSIDNLLILSDLYNVSLDELIRGGNYLKKPFIMGKKTSAYRIIVFLIIWLFVSLFFTGFGYQPLVVLIIIYLIGILFILPTIIDDYWILEKKGISIQKYPSSSLKKLKKIGQFLKSDKGILFIPYSDIKMFELIYTKKIRFSPFDINPDNFFIRVTNFEEDNYNLQVSPDFIQYLPQIISYLEKKDILILDNSNIAEAIIKRENLFEYMHKEK